MPIYDHLGLLITAPLRHNYCITPIGTLTLAQYFNNKKNNELLG